MGIIILQKKKMLRGRVLNTVKVARAGLWNKPQSIPSRYYSDSWSQKERAQEEINVRKHNEEQLAALRAKLSAEKGLSEKEAEVAAEAIIAETPAPAWEAPKMSVSSSGSVENVSLEEFLDFRQTTTTRLRELEKELIELRRRVR